jgi:ABC-type Fe3+-hydroxamate transport system substrate-binding protein
MYIQSTDQLGNTLQVPFPPKRIVSLVPSQTEFLFDIGLSEEIVGITRFCIHPADKVKGKTKIGGTKKFDIEKIKSLQPDLIIGNKEENYESGISELSRYFPVWMSDIYTRGDAFSMMLETGRITGKSMQAAEVVTLIANRLDSFFNACIKWNGEKTCAYFIWRKPYMVAAGNTFIDSMLQLLGFRNVFNNLKRYPEIIADDLKLLNPDYIFLSSEPYSFSEKHFAEFQAFAPNAKVVLVDGEMFSWYGSRLMHVPAYYLELHKAL